MTPPEPGSHQIRPFAVVNARFLAGTALFLAGLILFSAPAALAQEAPNYLPRPKGPLEVAGTPVGLGIGNRNGGRGDDLSVLNRSSGGFQYFSNPGSGRLELAGTTGLPGTSGSNDAISQFIPDSDAPYHAFAHPDTGSVSLLKYSESRNLDELVAEIPAGTNPSSATVLSEFFTQIFAGGSPGGLPALGVTDSSDDTFSLIYSASPSVDNWSIGVGKNPAAATAIGDTLWFIANQGSDDVSLVRLNVGDAYPQPQLEDLGRIPVGDGPVDLVYFHSGENRDSVAVVNRDSGSVSILDLLADGGKSEAREIQQIEVGSKPTSITVARVNDDGLDDLVVTNSGSDDISLLINKGDGHFEHGQRISVGDRPVDVVAMRLDRYFIDDLAVANAGDDDVSLLLRRDGTAKCQSRPAHQIAGTDGNDMLYGTRDPDRTRGFNGNDRIYGGRAYDCISGGAGHDFVFGGANNDRIFGGSAKDKLIGRVGNDLIRAGKGNDVICDHGDRPHGCFYARSNQHDYRPNASDRDRIFGGPGNDRILVGPDRDRVDAGPGDDRIDSMDGDLDWIDCGPGRDLAKVDIKDRTRNCERVKRREPGFRH